MLQVLAPVLIALGPFAAGAQETVRVNLATTAVGIPGVGVQWRISERRSRQVDLTISPWVSRNHAPAFFMLVVAEERWHAREVGRGLYGGLHVGLAGFRFQKPFYFGTDFYQEGAGVVGGVAAGYERQLRPGLRMDLFVGGGTAQSKYKGYTMGTGERYDGDTGWNESGEWLPYRVGLSIAWRLD